MIEYKLKSLCLVMMITFLFLCFNQGSQIVSVATMVQNVKILAITQLDLSLDVVINFLKCFPCLEKLYIKVTKLIIP
jgi:hypothetical protein